jgi:hypothetical protein
MHALIMTQSLDQAKIAAHAELYEEVSPAVTAVRGLVSLTWLVNLETSSAGGFYLFERKSDFDRFVASELFDLLKDSNASMSDFAVGGHVTSMAGKEQQC